MSHRLSLALVVVAVVAVGSYAFVRHGTRAAHSGPEATTMAAAAPATVLGADARLWLVSHLAHRLLRSGEACPATRPNPRSYVPPAGFRSFLNGDLRGIYGHGPMAVILPAGRVNVNRDPHHGWYREKIGWWIDVPGALGIAARRIDRPSTLLGHSDIAPPNPIAAHRIEPTNIVLPAPGCWQVAGGVGRNFLTWIFRARA